MFKTQCHNSVPIRIDKFLAKFLENTSRQYIKELIKNKYISKNDKLVKKPKELVSLGDIITINTLEIKKQVFNSQQYKIEKNELLDKVNIVFEHKDFLVIDKPAGLLVHKTNNLNSYSLVDFLLKKYPEINGVVDNNQSNEFILQNRCGVVHRIDKDTSGLIIFARNKDSLIKLKEIFKQRKIYKEYTCLVRGDIKENYGEIKYPITRSKLEHTKRVAVINIKQSNKIQRSAYTEYWVLDRYNDSTLLKIVIHTGRTHQIRVHLQAIGHPIIGDKLYGGKLEKKDNESLNRQFLHANKIIFEYMGQKYEFNSKLPVDLNDYLHRLN